MLKSELDTQDGQHTAFPDVRNAHPHTNNEGNLFLIHNGIIENYAVIKKALSAEGYKFYSDTDTEVLVNLIDKNIKLKGDFFQGVRFALKQNLKGLTELPYFMKISLIKLLLLKMVRR